MRRRWLASLVVATLPAVAISGVNAEQSPTVVDAVQLTGLSGVKENAKGKLSVQNANLHWIVKKNKIIAGDGGRRDRDSAPRH